MITSTATVHWRPSRCVAVTLCAFGLLGALGAWASDLPRDLAAMLGVAASTLGVLGARRETRRPPRVFAIDPAGVGSLDGVRLAGFDLHWRGPLAFLVARDDAGRAHRLAFWPDVLDAEGRRVLRLVSTAHHTPAVAG
jgi:toxin CptA